MIRSNGFVLLSIMMLAGGLSVSAQNAAPANAATDAKDAPVLVITPAKKAPAPSDIMAGEWSFLKSYGASIDEDVVVVVQPELAEWLKMYPESDFAPEAQLLKANIHLRLGDYRSAIVDLLKHVQEYPGAESNAAAEKLLTATIDKKMDKKAKAVLTMLAKAPEAAEKPERLAALLEKMSDRAGVGVELYDPLVNEFRDFFGRFPSYAGRDSLQLALGGLHVQKEEYLRAKLAYTELIIVYPGSPLLVKAKRALGDVLANNLKDYDGAINVYQDVATTYPGTDEAWAAYVQLAKLSERQKKFALAVETHEKIIALYPEKEAAYESYKAEARILREEMSKLPESIAVLNRLADKYKGDRAIEALWLAAKIAKKDLKDLAAEVRTYDRIAAEYSATQGAKAQFAAAEAYKDAGNFDKAKEYYTKVSEKYPEDKLAEKSRDRIDSIMNK